MTRQECIDLVLKELEKAEAKSPQWPTHPLHALSVLGEEFGELVRATRMMTYEPHRVSLEELDTEAIQTAAMALRFLFSLKQGKYVFAPATQRVADK